MSAYGTSVVKRLSKAQANELDAALLSIAEQEKPSCRLREENPQDSAKLTDDADSSTGDPAKLIIEHPQHEASASIGLLDGSESFDDGMRLFVSEALGRTMPCASTGNERRDERSA